METQQERLQSLRASFKLDLNAMIVVAHEPVQVQRRRQPVHERTETHALDDALDFQPHPYPAGRRKAGGQCSRTRFGIEFHPCSFSWPGV